SGDGTAVRQQTIDEQAPGLLITDEGVAVIREWNRNDSLSQHVRNLTKGQAGLRFSSVIEHHISVWFPSIGVRRHAHPVRSVKNAAGNLVDQPAPQWISSRIHADNVQVITSRNPRLDIA